MKGVKTDFVKLWSYISNNTMTYFSQSIFFFVSVFVLVFCNQIFLNMIIAEGNKVYSQLVESQVLIDFGPFILKAIFIVIIWILVMTLVYTCFQGAIWFTLSKCKKVKSIFLPFAKESLKWISILFLLMFIHLLLSVLLLAIFKSSPYSTTASSLFLSILQLVLFFFVINGTVYNHAYFLTKKKASFKSAFKFGFKLSSLRITFYYLVYLGLMQFIGSFIIDFSLLIFIFVGVSLSLGTMAYYIMALDVVKNEA